MTGPDKIRTEAKLAAKHGMKEIGPALRELVADRLAPPAFASKDPAPNAC